MTAVPRDPAITEMRELFRSLSELRVAYETSGLEEMISPSGNRWSLWDIEYLYEKSQELLTLRQKQAITLCLVHNMREKQAAHEMGVSPTNPVMMYATLGIRRLLDMIEEGRFERFHRQNPYAYREQRRIQALIRLAEHIQNKIKVERYTECWNFPSPPGQPARLRVKTVSTASGFMLIDPLPVVYEALKGSIPLGCYVVREPDQRPSCVNPDHAELRLSPQRKSANTFLLSYYQKKTA